MKEALPRIGENLRRDAVFDSGMRPDEVDDLMPVKPLGESENVVVETYRTRLTGLYEKLTQR